MKETTKQAQRILQLCHSYGAPFDDCARQYAALFHGTPYVVTTVFLSGKRDDAIVKTVNSDEVIFLEYNNQQLKGLKLELIKKIKELTDRKDFKLCIAHRTKPTYIALLATKLPVISVHHAFGDFDRLGRRVFVSLFKNRLTFFGVSNAVRDDMRKALISWPDTKFITLYNHVDPKRLSDSLLSREQARSMLGISQSDLIIANVGRLHPDKKQSTLIEAFALSKNSLPDNTSLVILGSGKLEVALKRQIQQLGIENQVKLLGQVANAKRLFRAFDLFVLTSNHEPFGMVLLEAMTAGLHTICTDCGGGREVVQDIGQLFPLGDSASLAKLLVEYFKSPNSQTTKIQHHVSQYFSDAAIKTQFWQLDIIKEQLPNTLPH